MQWLIDLPRVFKSLVPIARPLIVHAVQESQRRRWSHLRQTWVAAVVLGRSLRPSGSMAGATSSDGAASFLSLQ